MNPGDAPAPPRRAHGTQRRLGKTGAGIDRITDGTPRVEEIADLEPAAGVPVVEPRKNTARLRRRRA